MAHGWNTKKTSSGYKWSVHSTEWNDETGKADIITLNSGTMRTRARATGAAKKVCGYYRRKHGS